MVLEAVLYEGGPLRVGQRSLVWGEQSELSLEGTYIYSSTVYYTICVDMMSKEVLNNNAV